MKNKAESAKTVITDENYPTLRSRIAHPKFGEGEVIAVNGYGDRLKVVVRFEAENTTQERKLLWYVASTFGGAKIVEKRHIILPEDDHENTVTIAIEGLDDDEIAVPEDDEEAASDDEE